MGCCPSQAKRDAAAAARARRAMYQIEWEDGTAIPLGFGYSPSRINEDTSHLCVACCEALDDKTAVRCNSMGNGRGHGMCPYCFTNYICINFYERDFGGEVPTVVPCCGFRCQAGFDGRTVAAHGSALAWERYSEKVRKAQLALEIAKLGVEYDKIVRENEKKSNNSNNKNAFSSSFSTKGNSSSNPPSSSPRSFSDVLLEKQMALQLSSNRALSCPRCGMVCVIEACDSLTAHHGEVRISAMGKAQTIKNCCSNCHFFSASKSGWNKFDGNIPTREEMHEKLAQWRSKNPRSNEDTKPKRRIGSGGGDSHLSTTPERSSVRQSPGAQRQSEQRQHHPDRRSHTSSRSPSGDEEWVSDSPPTKIHKRNGSGDDDDSPSRSNMQTQQQQHLQFGRRSSNVFTSGSSPVVVASPLSALIAETHSARRSCCGVAQLLGSTSSRSGGVVVASPPQRMCPVPLQALANEHDDDDDLAAL